jgi:LCP family protein required for cell wall assembly
VAFREALAKVPYIVALNDRLDETGLASDVLAPTSHPFECWSDAALPGGRAAIQQPVIQPLFDTRGLLDLLLEWGAAAGDQAAAAAVAAAEHNFNIDIHYYVVIDWVGFVQLIDALGGIDLVVPEDIADFGTDVLDVYPNNTVKAGEQHMDGAQALGYSRVRVDGDIKRIERQQIVIKAVASKSVSLGYLAKIPELWEAYRGSFRTDIQTAQVPGFALLAKQMNLETIETFSLAPALYGGISEDAQLILLPNRDEMYAIIDRFFADPQLRDEAPSVVLEYPEGQDEAARLAIAHLGTYGIPREYLQMRKAEAPGEPGVFDLTGKPYTAGKLTGLFDLRLLNPPESLAGEGIDVLVRLGPATALKSP